MPSGEETRPSAPASAVAAAADALATEAEALRAQAGGSEEAERLKATVARAALGGCTIRPLARATAAHDAASPADSESAAAVPTYLVRDWRRARRAAPKRRDARVVRQRRRDRIPRDGGGARKFNLRRLDEEYDDVDDDDDEFGTAAEKRDARAAEAAERRLREGALHGWCARRALRSAFDVAADAVDAKRSARARRSRVVRRARCASPPSRATRGSLDHAKRETHRLGCVTCDEEGAWFAVDLGAGRRLFPSHYALQHGGHRQGRRLRNWVLEARTRRTRSTARRRRARAWTELARHVDDAALADGAPEDGCVARERALGLDESRARWVAARASACFACAAPAPIVGPRRAALGGIELYGVATTFDPRAAREASRRGRSRRVRRRRLLQRVTEAAAARRRGAHARARRARALAAGRRGCGRRCAHWTRLARASDAARARLRGGLRRGRRERRSR